MEPRNRDRVPPVGRVMRQRTIRATHVGSGKQWVSVGLRSPYPDGRIRETEWRRTVLRGTALTPTAAARTTTVRRTPAPPPPDPVTRSASATSAMFETYAP
ncbi:hypothetical protein ThrDRAFT_01577 [Frankia casuarinae]|nr:hypothetical protein CcI6DRAFT_01993 [Frankia sp. CcI6]EYT92801.1 hypothetical protein ThrDRAFT_01577 [Frankia casuarinae]KDA43241.1 hypothetical protein BMG523Draft_01929 [Frankia sp. BMG5.23]OAA30484.1 hypothetical protein AAY23_100747 [Frankia casuarinae]